MSDTVRTLSALQTLLADNTTGTISPQDLRDAVISALGHLFVAATSTGITLDDDDIVVLATGGAGGITLTLPAVAAAQHKVYAVFKVDAGAGAVSVDAAGSETINGSSSAYALASQWDGAVFFCDGTQWVAGAFA